MKKRLKVLGVLVLVVVLVVSVMTGLSEGNAKGNVEKAEAASTTRNVNNVIQMPCDGLAYNSIGEYAVEESGTNLSSLTFPTVEETGEIDMEQIRTNVEEYLANYLEDTQVGRVFFNVNYTRSAVPSDVFDTFAYDVGMQEDGTVAEGTEKTLIEKPTQFKDVQYFWYALQENIDLIGMGIDYVNANDVEAWASFRMNDHHYPSDTLINASFRYNYASTWGVNGSSAYMDYTVEAVQSCYLNYIKEVVTNYDELDGIELDFLRTAPYMSNENKESMQILNDFVKRIKTEINEIRPNMKVAVRVYATEELNLGYGLDVAQWVADGSVDVVTVANFYMPTSFDLPIEAWRESIDARNTEKYDYVILAGLDWGVKSHPYYYLAMTPAHTRGFVSAAYANGADGTYLFNMFYLDGYFATEYKISEDGVLTSENIFKERMLASDSLESAESGLRRYTYGYLSTFSDYWSTIPRKLAGYSSTAFKMQTGTAPEEGYYMVTIGVDEAYTGYDANNLIVTLNGKPLKQIGDMPRSSDMPVVSTSSEYQAKHLTQVAQRFVQFVVTDLNEVQDGYNVINVINKSGKTQNILWVEVFVDGTDGATPVIANQ